VLIASLCYFINTKIKGQNQTINNNIKTLAEKKETTEEFENLKQIWPTLPKDIDILKKTNDNLALKKADQKQIIAEIERTAVEAKLILKEIKIDITKGKVYQSTLTGKYEDIKTFIKKAENNNLVLTMNIFRIEPKKDENHAHLEDEMDMNFYLEISAFGDKK